MRVGHDGHGRGSHGRGGHGRAVTAGITGSAVTGAAVTGSAVTGSAVAGSAITAAAVTGSAITGSAVTGPANTGAAAVSQTTGEATHYVLQPGDGNCSYPAADTNQLFVALSPGEYGAAAACGSYLEVTGPDGSVTAEVVDQCPECQPGHIDLGEQAFAKIAPLSAGLVPVTYHTIVNPPLPAPLSLRVKEGSSAYWLALLPISNGNPVTSVRVSSPSKDWQSLTHASYNYWLATSGLGPGPFSVQLTDSVGHQVTMTGITLTPGLVQATGTSMYGAGASAAVVAAPAVPTAGVGATRSPAAARTSASPLTSGPAPVPSAAVKLAAASPTPSC